MNIYDLLNMSYLADKRQIQKELIRLAEKNKNPNFWNEVMEEYKKFQELGKEAYDKQMETKDGKEYDDKVMTSVNIVNHNSYNKSLEKLVNSYDSNGKFKLDRENSVKKTTKTSKFKKVVKVILPIVLATGIVVTVACCNVKNDSKDFNLETTTSYTDDSSVVDTKFKYIVQHGDSYSSLKERFGSDSEIYSSSAMLQVFDTITIDAHNIEIKKEMDELYQSQMKENEPISFESYTIKPGDTLPAIANTYGITCEQIMKYNLFIENIQEIYAGDTLKIPVYKDNVMKK